MDWTYSELLKKVGAGWRYHGDTGLLTRPVAEVSIDSRRIRGGELFVALRGERFDGHEFAAAALQSGAIAAVVERRWWESASQPEGNFFLVEDTLLALQEMAACYRRRFDIPVLALTGSSGKTTTKELIAAVLETRYRVLKTEGNLNNHIGVPLTLLRLSSDHEIAVVELGMNHPGEIARLTEITAPTHALVTNIGKGHLGFFDTIEDLARAKMELFEGIAEHGTAFINADDPLICATKPRIARVVRFSLTKPVDVHGEYLGLDDRGSPVVRLTIEGDSEVVHVPISGRHNAINAVAAAAVGHHFGIPLSDIKRGIESCSPVTKRMEVLRRNNMVIINDCYNANPDSMRAALELLRDMKAPKGASRVAILADMLELGAFETEEHRALGKEVVSYGADRLLAYGKASAELVAAARSAGLTKAEHFTDKEALLRAARETVAEPCVVLVKGSRSMAMEDVVDVLLGRSS
jgi:UDP-N-acetylmuramoyl-tripeptide--D-alanyl-D-alanine ligase